MNLQKTTNKVRHELDINLQPKYSIFHIDLFKKYLASIEKNEKKVLVHVQKILIFIPHVFFSLPIHTQTHTQDNIRATLLSLLAGCTFKLPQNATGAPEKLWSLRVS